MFNSLNQTLPFPLCMCVRLTSSQFYYCCKQRFFPVKLITSNIFRGKLLIENDHGSARGVMVIVVGNGHSDSSSNPGREWLHFT